MLTGDRCRPILEEMSDGSFAVTFRLVPSKGFIDVRIIQTIELLLYEDISRVLNTLAMDLHLQPIQIFLKLTHTLKSRRGALKWRTTSSYKEAIKYVAIRVIVSFQFYELKNSKLLIEELSDKLYSVDFAITGGLTTEFADISFEQYEFKLHEEMTEHPPSSDLMTNFSWYPYDPSRFGLITPFTDSQDGLGVLPVSVPLIEHGKHLRLLQFGFCPLVMLSKNEFSVPIEHQSVYLTYKNEHINMSQVLFSSNDSSIILCSKDYIYGDGNQSHQSDGKQDTSFNTEVVLSIVCTSVSLLSLMVVFITYCMFKTLRTLPGLNLMALVISLFFAQLFYLLGGVLEIPWKWLCEALGLLLHFCLVSSFFWMGVCTFHMMKVFALMSSRVTHENVRPRFIKYCVFVVASSAIIVSVNILVSMLEESSLGYGGQPCYITRKNMIFFTVAIPLVVIIISNLIMFAYVVIKVCKLPEVQRNTKHQRQNLVIFIKLSTLTGITWVFAFIYQWTSMKAFAYLYIIANASQGLFILFSFVINKRVYSMVNASYQSSYLYKVSHKSRTDTGVRSSGEAVQNGALRLQLNHL